MALISNINLYIDKESIGELINSYNTSIKTLTDLYMNFENEVNELGDNESWTGESFDKFKEEFSDWKMKYLKSLSELAELKEFLEQVKSTCELLIGQRNDLKKPLGV